VVAATGVAALEIPSVLSREMGDIHPQGNPHVWLDPLLAKQEADNIADALKRVDPSGADYYEQRKADFDKRIDNAMFGEELVKLVGIQKLTRLVQTGELRTFLETTKLGGQPLSTKTGGWLKQAEALNGVKGLRVSQGLGVFRARFWNESSWARSRRGPEFLPDLSTYVTSQTRSKPTRFR
jgi:hypothetical protein